MNPRNNPESIPRQSVMNSLFSPRQYAALIALVAHIRRNRLSYLEPAALLELAAAAKMTDRAKLTGCFVEAGCAWGGSAIVLTSVKGPRALYCYDVFGLIPPPSDQDGPDVRQRYADIRSGASQGIDGGPYYGYEPDLLTKVRRNFERAAYPPDQCSVHFVQGLYSETLFPDFPVALAHIDCDWHDSVKCCLERIHPHLVPGGRFVIDDYFAWSGCKSAVDEFLAAHPRDFVTERHQRLHIVRRNKS